MQQDQQKAERCASCGAVGHGSGAQVLIPSVFFRALLMVSMWCTASLEMNTPSSSTAVLIEKAGTTGALAAGVFMLAFLYMVIDAIANDMLPPRYRSAVLRTYRWTAVAASSVVYLVLAAASTMPSATLKGAWVLTVYYTAVACIAMWLALHTRVKRYVNEMAVHNADSKQA